MNASTQVKMDKQSGRRRTLTSRLLRPATQEALAGYLAISPWIIGFFGFTVFPLLASLYLSFTKYNLLRPPQWTGMTNYLALFQDERFIASLLVTGTYVVVAVPLHLVLAFLVAEMM